MRAVWRAQARWRWTPAKWWAGCVSKKACHSERSLRSEESPIPSLGRGEQHTPAAAMWQSPTTTPSQETKHESNSFMRLRIRSNTLMDASVGDAELCQLKLEILRSEDSAQNDKPFDLERTPKSTPQATALPPPRAPMRTFTSARRRGGCRRLCRASPRIPFQGSNRRRCPRRRENARASFQSRPCGWRC
jgi:hypothetical protein